MRLAALETVVSEDVRGAPMAAYRDAAERLQAAGAAVEPLEAPEVAEAMEMSNTLFTGEAYGLWGDVIEAAPERMFAPVLARFRAGREVSAPAYVAAWRRLEALRARWNARVAGFDAVILPTAANMPPAAARLLSDDAYYATENLLTLRNTRVGNLMGLCAVTLPTGVPSCGVMLLGAPMGEARLLRLAAAAEAALA